MTSSSDEECRVCLCLRPSWGQRLANRRLFTFCYALLTVVQMMSWIYIVTITTSVENHFQLPSKSIGVVMTVSEGVNFLTGLLAGVFLGANSHLPRTLAIALCIYAVGAFLFVLPYYYYGSPTPLDVNTTAAEQKAANFLCSAANLTFNETVNGNNADEEKCLVQLKAPTEDVTSVVAMFIAAYLICTIGSSLIHIVGTPFIDDNVQNKNSPLYIAITSSVRTLGLIFGSFLGTLCLNIYIDPTVEPWFDNSDRRWVGAWWIGFIIQGILAVICAFLTAQFPRRLPTTEITPAVQMMEMESKSTSNNDMKSILQSQLSIKFSDMKSNLREVLTNLLLWCRVLSETFTWFGLEGYILCLPKFLEHQFKMTASAVSLATGAALISPSIVGNLTVGYLIQRLQPTARQLAAALVVSKSTEALLMGLQMLIQCNGNEIVGSVGISAACADTDCNCSSAIFSPVCGSDQITYFSACHAGCATEGFTNCSCVLGGEGLVTPMACQSDCSSKWAYLVITGIAKLCLSVEIVAGTLFLLRCVEPQQKIMATALLFAFISIFSFTPCPMVFSALVDSACSVWGKQCGRTGACEVYDLEFLRLIVHALPVMLMCGGIFWDIVFWWKVKDRINLFKHEIKK